MTDHPTTTPFQIPTLVALAAGAFLAVPYLYQHRMDATVFWGGVAIFCVVPPVAGMLHALPSRPLTFAALTILVACPFVYLVTDRMDAKVEVSRDCYFLASFAIVSYISGTWLGASVHGRRWTAAAAAAFCVTAASSGAFIPIALVMYLE